MTCPTPTSRSTDRASTMTLHALETPHGTAHAHVARVDAPRAVLVLGHGAGGGIDAPDLLAVAQLARELHVTVVRVEQPYRVAGRRAPAPARQLDAAWIAVIEQLRPAIVGDTPLLVGGRSMGARVACRTAAELDAIGVLCLAFPLQPRPRTSGSLAPSRLPELDGVQVPMLVVQGARDPFGMPPAAPGRTVALVAGDHSLKADLPAVCDAARSWLTDLLAAHG